MKNPNGYGTVVKLSGNRRRPWAVRKSFGQNEKGHPVLKTIGYAAPKEEGMIMLAKYNSNPYDLDTAKITFEELYNEWVKRPNKLSKNTLMMISSAFNGCKELYSMSYKNIKTWHMQNIINQQKPSMQQWYKKLFVHLDKYAAEMDIIDKMCSQFVAVDTVISKEKTIFTKDEIASLWNIKNEPYVDSVLFLLYTGYRIGEMLSLRRENVDLEKGILKGGNKTAAGKNKIVPIHSKIFSIVEARYHNNNSEFLFTCKGKKYDVNTYRKQWENIMRQINAKHTPHECRHTFRTELSNITNDIKAIDMLMGHVSQNTGIDVYTHKSIGELKNIIELITY